jgi:hypothetical protein
MPVFKMYKNSNYSHIAANKPIRAGTLNIGSFRGKGSYSRMFTQCKQNSANPSGCINQFVAFIPPPAPKPTPTPPPIPPPVTNGNILFDISSFSKRFNSETGDVEPVESAKATSVYKPLPKKAINALTKAAKRWAYFLSFTPEYVEVMRTNIKNWNGIPLNKFLISTKYPERPNGDWENTLAASRPLCSTIKQQPTSFIFGSHIYLKSEVFKKYSETQLFHLLSHELGHILGFGSMTVTDDKGVELLPNIYFDAERNAKFYLAQYFPDLYRVYYNFGFLGIYIDDKGKEFVKKENKTHEFGLYRPHTVPLSTDGKHFSPDSMTYELSPGYTNPAHPVRVGLAGFYNEIMVPEFSPSQDKENNYLITEFTLRVLTALYTPYNGKRIENYQLLRTDMPDYGSEEGPSAGEDLSRKRRKEDNCIQFEGKAYNPSLNKEIKIEDEDEEEEDESLCKETLIHTCCVCKPIYLDVFGECA